MADTIPSKARIWQYAKTAGGLENHLRLIDAPIPKQKPDEHLIRVIAASLNPVDYKPAEAPIVGGLLVRKPATPGCDIAGELIVPAAGSSLKQGQLVFGAASRSPFAAGGLAEYIAAPKEQIIAIPQGISAVDAASVPVAGLTAYQTIKPHVKKGDRIFLNGGSGGVGLFGIQIAKALGCHVTVTCSSKNVEFCKSYGADEVVDYTKGNVVSQLKALDYKLDHVIDNVGHDHDLYWKCDQYTKPTAQFINVASSPAWKDISFMMKANILPSFLGGGKRKFSGFFAQPVEADLQQIVRWMQDGTVKACIDARFPMEELPEAFRKLKTGRTRGKIIVDVAKEDGA